VILKCLEKDKNNRYPDVSQLALALQEVISIETGMAAGASSSQGQRLHAAEPMEPSRGDGHHLGPAAMPSGHDGPMHMPGPGQRPFTPPRGASQVPSNPFPQPPHGMQRSDGTPSYPQAAPYQQQLALQPTASSAKWIWWIVALLALGAAAGAVLAIVLR
jgi:hypothetical protein